MQTPSPGCGADRRIRRGTAGYRARRDSRNGRGRDNCHPVPGHLGTNDPARMARFALAPVGSGRV